ncbi:MAG: AMP-dependent synthetase and ligase, partial [Dehalococcoidia bacterium]|nr:AMP-dependent synthetase and ligase [Dehalococcoidia bacterium]
MQNTIRFLSGAKHHTFSELNTHANSLVQGLHRLGLKTGDRLAILADNCPEYIETIFAAAKAGLVIVPINTRLREEDIAFIIQDSGASVLILSEGCWELIKSIRHLLTAAPHFITIGNGPGENYEGLVTSPHPREYSVPLKEEDLYCIAYTGGTTGLPKGAMLSHRNILAATIDGILDFGFNFKDVGLVCHPLFHISALWTLFTLFYLGNRCVLMKSFDAHLLLETVENEKVTSLALASPLVIALLHEPDINKFDFSSLRVLLYAGTPL